MSHFLEALRNARGWDNRVERLLQRREGQHVGVDKSGLENIAASAQTGRRAAAAPSDTGHSRRKLPAEFNSKVGEDRSDPNPGAIHGFSMRVRLKGVAAGFSG